MGKKKKPFIDKKKSVKFQLVHRDQKDPLQADSDAPEMVLHPIDSSKKTERKEEQKKFGVFYDDDYDYLQHLKVRGEGTLVMTEDNTNSKPKFKDIGGISLPSDVLASEYEEQQGLLEKGVLPRGPQPHWDPDIVEALDDGLDLDDPDNILDDDFIMLAGAEVREDNDISDFQNVQHPHNHRLADYGGDSDDGHDEFHLADSDVDSDGFDFDSVESGSNFSQEETKSRFTNYSMTSSVIRRTEGLRLIDDCFEKIMEEYDDDDIGGLDEDAAGGVLNPENPFVSQMIDEVNEKQITTLQDFKESEQSHEMKDVMQEVPVTDSKEDDDDEDDADDDDTDDDDFEIFHEREKEKWDCESVISSYSNIYNLPTTIPPPQKPIKLTKKLGIPADVLKRKEKDSEEQIAESELKPKAPVFRPKNEDKQQKRLRKKAVKEEKRERRAEKKANKIAFKFEHKIQEKIVAHQPVLSSLKMD